MIFNKTIFVFSKIVFIKSEQCHRAPGTYTNNRCANVIKFSFTNIVDTEYENLVFQKNMLKLISASNKVMITCE